MSIQSSLFYRWDECESLPITQRVDLKERSASAASTTLTALQKEVTKACDAGVIPESVPVSAANDVASWLQEIGSVNDEHRNSEILVGVAGSTGAGKTSLLNALLNLQEFLPSSCKQAATSVVSRVSWNYDERPGYEFRAEVRFCTRKDITKLIKRTFQHLQDLEDIQTQVYEHVDDRISDQAEAQHILDELVPKITAVWGFTVTELHDMTPDEVLRSEPDVWSLLERQVVQFNSSSAETLSQQVKPYLDSTADTHGSDRQFAAWPLVRDVRLFVRADILKDGMSLVDLPGLGDVIESRAALAQDFYDKLAVTIIVAPIVRAADETTAKNLLSRHQALQLQMSNKFNKKGMVVALTKTDDLDIEAYLRHSPEAKKRPELVQDRDSIKEMAGVIKELQSKKRALEKAILNSKKLIKTLQRREKQTISMLQKAKAKAKATSVEKLEQELQSTTNAKKNIQSVYRAHRNRLIDIKRDKASTANARAHRTSKIAFECISMRNDAVEKRIRASFRADQRKFRGKRFNAEDHDIDVLHVSSQAFWRIADFEDPVLGFPRQNFTGIPWARHWLRHCTAQLREDHLDLMLHKFQRLVNWISQWSRDHGDGQEDLQFTAEEIEDAHARNHEQGREALNIELKDLKNQIDELNPLGNVKKAIEKASKAAILTVGRWSLKAPENLASTSKMHWLTYKANVSRHGGIFRARGQDNVVREYHWNESLTVLLLDNVVGSWNICVNEKIPSLSGPILERIDFAWYDYMDYLSTTLDDLDSIGHLATVLEPANATDNLEPIRQEMK